MKITWFGSSCFRLNYGGAVLVIEPAQTPAGIDPVELVSGADRVLTMDDAAISVFDPAMWTAPKPRRGTDADAADPAPSAEVARLRPGLFLQSRDEPAIVVLDRTGRADPGGWSEGAVLIVADLAARHAAVELLKSGRIRLLALALEDADIEGAVAAFKPDLGRAGLMVLERGLALEI